MDKISATRRLRWPLIFAAATAAAGISLSLYLRSRMIESEAANARLVAETLRQNTEQELAQFAEVLESARALINLSDAVNQAAMDEFIQKGLVHQHAVLGSFGLIQRIGPQLRADREKAAAQRPGTGYRVIQAGPDKSWIPAKDRSVYYPLIWQSRSNGLEIPVGFDFASDNAILQTLEKISFTQRTTLAPVPVTDPTADAPAYWVFAPILSQPVPIAIIGFSVAILRPERILKQVAARTAPAPELKMTLITRPDNTTSNAIRLSGPRWYYTGIMTALGTPWRFECSLPDTAAGRPNAGLAFGLAVTALMTALLLILAGRTHRIELEVLRRTEDLRIANLQLEKNLQERAQMEEEINEITARERRRVGRDLHDSLGQKLTGAVFLSRSLLTWFQGESQSVEQETREIDHAERLPGTDTPPLSTQTAHARTLNETLKSAVAQVRNMARGLAPVTLNDENLCEAIAQLAEEMTGLYGVSCEVAECAEPAGLERKAKEQLYLIAREAVNNAARHAQADRITLRLTANEAAWQLCVEDNGKGLSEKMSPTGEGMGIRIMRHRASLIGATFSISPASNRGTCVSVTSNTRIA